MKTLSVAKLNKVISFTTDDDIIAIAESILDPLYPEYPSTEEYEFAGDISEFVEMIQEAQQDIVSNEWDEMDEEEQNEYENGFNDYSFKRFQQDCGNLTEGVKWHFINILTNKELQKEYFTKR